MQLMKTKMTDRDDTKFRLRSLDGLKGLFELYRLVTQPKRADRCLKSTKLACSLSGCTRFQLAVRGTLPLDELCMSVWLAQRRSALHSELRFARISYEWPDVTLNL